MQKKITRFLISILGLLLLLSACKVCPAEGLPFFCDEFKIEVTDSLAAAVPVTKLSTLKLTVNNMAVPFDIVRDGEITAFATVMRDAGCGTVSDVVLKDSFGLIVAEMKAEISNFNASHRDKSERKGCGCYSEIAAIEPLLNVEVVDIKCGENKVRVVWND